MKILIAGSNSRESENKTKQYNLGKLYSILSEKKDIEKWNDKHLLMVDSGAHSWNKSDITVTGVKGRSKLPSAKIFLKDYSNFIKKYSTKKVIFVEFDVYGKLDYQDITDEYNKIMQIDGNFKIIRVYHPVLDGGSFDILKQWIDEGQDYIGIGNDSIPYLDKIFLMTEDKIKIHGFAMTKLSLLEKYPFFSVDSTTPLSTVLFGNYPNKFIGMKDKKKVIEEKSIEIFHDDWERLENALIKVKKTEKYLTQLWKNKGIIWNELF